ncbi:MAG TPA: cobalamin-independent methionine synthase II family protein [bacterium]
MFPVTTVGSLPRSAAMLDLLRRKQRGKISAEEFQTGADAEVLRALRVQEEAGADLVTDGEQRRDNFYSFIADRTDGVTLYSLAELLDHVEDKAAFERILQALDVPAFAIRNPVVTGKIARRKTLAAEDVAFLKRHTQKPIKVALPGPYLLTRSMWVKSLTAEIYPTKESLGEDVVRLLREELLALREAGCAFVQFDEPVLSEVAFAGPHATHTFMCAALSEKASPESELNFAVELINEVVKGVDGIRTGLHVCRGNWSRKEDVLLAGAYDPLVPYFSRMNVDQFVLEYATDRAGSVDVLAALPEEKEIGLGVVNPRTSEIESVEFIVDKVRGLLKKRAAEKIFLNPDCGFGTFADRPVSTEEIAGQKLSAISAAAKVLRA